MVRSYPPVLLTGNARAGGLRYVIRKHRSSRLHYDLALELDGTFKTWAVPQGPSLNPQDRRTAVQAADHPLDEAPLRDGLPSAPQGIGNDIVWDEGLWMPASDPRRGLHAGRLEFELRGHKLQGHWTLERVERVGRGESGAAPPWLLTKAADEAARDDGYEITTAEPDSARTPPRARAPRPHGKKRSAAAALPAEARRARLPALLRPQLATRVRQLPADPANWLFEARLDGHRLLTRVDGDHRRLFTRSGADWTPRLPELAQALQSLPLRSGWLDGEIVLPGPDGVPDFQALQAALEGAATSGIVYYLFDLPFYTGYDLRAVPLTERRTLLGGLLGRQACGPLRLSEALSAGPADLLASAHRQGFDELVGKRLDSAYAPRRTRDWITLRCGLPADPPAGREVQELPAPANPREPGAGLLRAAPELTHAHRVVDSHSGFTKGDIATYYARVAALLLPHLRGRPAALVRAPAGVDGELFFQSHARDGELPGLRPVPAPDAGPPLMTVPDARALRSLAQANTLELQTGNALATRIATPDRMAFDLDPGEGVAWALVVEAAQLLRGALQELRLKAFLKTSGGRGLHVVVPLRRHHGWATVKAFSRALVEHLAHARPERFSVRPGARPTGGRVFIDDLRNGFGATLVSAWSLRARPGLGISVPVSWDELPQLHGGAHWTLANIGERLAIGNAPWQGYPAARRGLAGAMKALGFTPP
ncbi:MAG: non-homologous end-joining DNA ligase [Ramlibacter sp.]|nr:non-homologous end-joining DNA ligase [Ramlibacter sp.]